MHVLYAAFLFWPSIFFIENLQKYLKCTEKHSVKVQINIDTENEIMQSRELYGK